MKRCHVGVRWLALGLAVAMLAACSPSRDVVGNEPEVSLAPLTGGAGTVVVLTGSFPSGASISVCGVPLSGLTFSEGNGAIGAPSVPIPPSRYGKAEGKIPSGVDGLCSVRVVDGGETVVVGAFMVEGSGTLTADAGNGAVRLDFEPPSEPVVGYEISTDAGTTWRRVDGDQSAPPLLISGLVNGVTYPVSVRPLTVTGPLPSLPVVEVTPRGDAVLVPSAPVLESVIASATSLSLDWSAPGFDGGGVISNFEVSLDGGQTWTAFDPAVTKGPAGVEGLEDGMEYSVAIRAVNGAGASLPSNIVPASTLDLPEAPFMSVEAGDGLLEVSFSPASDETVSITDYQVSLDGGGTWVSVGTQSPVVFDGLVNGSAYTVMVRAVGVHGAGDVSGPSSASPVSRATVPSAPSNLAASVSGSDVTLAFTPPESDGGSQITGYEVSVDGGVTWVSAGAGVGSPLTVSTSEFLACVPSSFNLRALNAVGVGPMAASPSNSVTPDSSRPIVAKISLDGSDTVFVGLKGNGLSIDWGDGSTPDVLNSASVSDVTHAYSAPGSYTVSVSGCTQAFRAPKLTASTEDGTLVTTEITSFGNAAITDLRDLFSSTATSTVLTSVAPIPASVTTLRQAFKRVTFNATLREQLAAWRTPNLMNLQATFQHAVGLSDTDFTGWDVSNVTTLLGTFQNANDFVGDVSNWDTGNVTTMASMFKDTRYFNGDITGWDVSKVTSFSSFLATTSQSGPSPFNQPLGEWDVSAATDFSYMFSFSLAFNQDLNAWGEHLGSAVTMTSMFYNAKAFNNGCASGVSSTDCSLNAWLPEGNKVSSLNSMFYQTPAFNAPIGDWKVENVTDVRNMFGGYNVQYRSRIDQDLSSWCLANYTLLPANFNEHGNLDATTLPRVDGDLGCPAQ